MEMTQATVGGARASCSAGACCLPECVDDAGPGLLQARSWDVF
jgi:hypothetical protein